MRIRWSWERGCSDFSLIDNHYKAEWLVPKKTFGFKYGYKFKRGNIYRILVREYIPRGNENFRKYYLEQVLEKDVNDPRLDPLYSFENKFEEEVTERLKYGLTAAKCSQTMKLY